MRKTSIGVLGLLMSLCLAQAGHAQEKRKKRAPAAAPAATTTDTWNGFQTGANGGNSSLAQNFAEPGAFLCPVCCSGPACPETEFAFSGHPSSFTFGGFGGYRVQVGNIVIGVETDLAWKKARSAIVQTGTTPLNVDETFSGSMTQGWDGSVRGRLGVLLMPSLLLYGTAGLAYSEVSGTFSYDAVYNSGGSSASVAGAMRWSDIRFGYTWGGGLEAAIGMGLKARIEYRLADFGHISKNVPLASTGCANFACGTNAHIDMNAAFHTVRLGLGWEL